MSVGVSSPPAKRPSSRPISAPASAAESIREESWKGRAEASQASWPASSSSSSARWAMPPCRSPKSAGLRSPKRRQSACDSSISGISRTSRAWMRIQPQFREDCSPAIRPFSQSTTGTPHSASMSAAVTPTTPPPMTTTSAASGSGRSGPAGNSGASFMPRSMRQPQSGAQPRNRPGYCCPKLRGSGIRSRRFRIARHRPSSPNRLPSQPDCRAIRIQGETGCVHAAAQAEGLSMEGPLHFVMFCHVPHALREALSFRSCISFLHRAPFRSLPSTPRRLGHPQAAGPFLRAYPARAPVPACTRLAPARFAHLIARARRRTHFACPLPPGSFFGPQPLLPSAEIGIGGSLTAPPLPHHRAYGSVHGGSTDLSCGTASQGGEAEPVEEGIG